MTRFEKFVEDQLDVLVKPERDRLVAALRAEEAAVEKVKSAYNALADEAAESFVAQVAAKAARDGDALERKEERDNAVKNIKYAMHSAVNQMLAAVDTYYEDGHYVWPEGTAARKAQDALEDFDETVQKTRVKLVVYKKDLGMRPQEFENMLAEAAREILEAARAARTDTEGKAAKTVKTAKTGKGRKGE